MVDVAPKKRIKDYGWWIIPAVVLCFRGFDILSGLDPSSF
jgi:hypothetical protein